MQSEEHERAEAEQGEAEQAEWELHLEEQAQLKADQDMVAYCLFVVSEAKDLIESYIDEQIKERVDSHARTMVFAHAELERAYCRLVTQFMKQDKNVSVLLSQKVTDSVRETVAKIRKEQGNG